MLECGHRAETLTNRCLDVFRVGMREDHVSNPVLKSENPDNPKKRGGQRRSSDNLVGQRILEALSGRPATWLAEKAGISPKTLSDYIANGIVKAEAAVAIATALDVSVDWLLTGRSQSKRAGNRSGALMAIDATNWVDLPRYDLRDLTDTTKGEPVEIVPMATTWLNRKLYSSTGFWLTELLSDYAALGLAEGDLVICSDLLDRPQEGWICLFRGSGGPFVARYSSRAPNEIINAGDLLGDVYLTAREIEAGEVFPIARLHARILTKL